MPQFVAAKLHQTQEYDLAGYSTRLPAGSAERLLEQTHIGEVELTPLERVVVSLPSPDFQWHAVIGVQRGAWEDRHGRPWVYRRTLLIPPAIFAAMAGDVFILEPQLFVQEDFHERRELPAVQIEIPEPAERLAREASAIRKIASHHALGVALASILSGEPVNWVLHEDSRYLLDGCLSAIPDVVRMRVSFATLAATVPRGGCRIIVSRVPIRSEPGSGRRIVDFSEGGPDSQLSDWGVAGNIARILSQWIAADDLAPLRLSEEELRAAVLDPAHQSIGHGHLLEQLAIAVSWVQSGIKVGGSPSSNILADRLRGAANSGEHVAARVVLGRIADVLPTLSVTNIEVAFSAVRGPLKDLAAGIGRAWATGKNLTSPDWLSLLNAVEKREPGSGTAVLDGLLEGLRASARLTEVLDLAEANAIDSLWSPRIVAVVRRAAELTSAGWNVPRLCRAACPLDRESVGSSAGWLFGNAKRLGALHDTSPGLRNLLGLVAEIGSKGSITRVQQLISFAPDQEEGVSEIAATALLLFVAARADAPPTSYISTAGHSLAIDTQRSSANARALWDAVRLVADTADSIELTCGRDRAVYDQSWRVAAAVSEFALGHAKHATNEDWAPEAVLHAGAELIKLLPETDFTSLHVTRTLTSLVAKCAPTAEITPTTVVSLCDVLCDRKSPAVIDAETAQVLMAWLLRAGARQTAVLDRIPFYAATLSRGRVRLQSLGQLRLGGSTDQQALCAIAMYRGAELAMASPADLQHFVTSVADSLGEEGKRKVFELLIQSLGRDFALAGRLCLSPEGGGQLTNFQPLGALLRNRRRGLMSWSFALVLSLLLPLRLRLRRHVRPVRE